MAPLSLRLLDTPRGAEAGTTPRVLTQEGGAAEATTVEEAAVRSRPRTTAPPAEEARRGIALRRYLPCTPLGVLQAVALREAQLQSLEAPGLLLSSASASRRPHRRQLRPSQ